jgi:hypothetical protein
MKFNELIFWIEHRIALRTVVEIFVSLKLTEVHEIAYYLCVLAPLREVFAIDVSLNPIDNLNRRNLYLVPWQPVLNRTLYLQSSAVLLLPPALQR